MAITASATPTFQGCRGRKYSRSAMVQCKELNDTRAGRMVILVYTSARPFLTHDKLVLILFVLSLFRRYACFPKMSSGRPSLTADALVLLRQVIVVLLHALPRRTTSSCSSFFSSLCMCPKVTNKPPLFDRARAISITGRYDKIARDVREKEESLAKARLDLNAELQAAGGVSIAAAPSPRTPLPVAAAGAFSGRAATAGLEPPSPGDGRGVSTPAPLSPGDSVSGRGGPGSVRRDGPWVLESLGLGQQVRGDRHY